MLCRCVSYIFCVAHEKHKKTLSRLAAGSTWNIIHRHCFLLLTHTHNTPATFFLLSILYYFKNTSRCWCFFGYVNSRKKEKKCRKVVVVVFGDIFCDSGALGTFVCVVFAAVCLLASFCAVWYHSLVVYKHTCIGSYFFVLIITSSIHVVSLCIHISVSCGVFFLLFRSSTEEKRTLSIKYKIDIYTCVPVRRTSPTLSDTTNSTQRVEFISLYTNVK